MRCFECKRNLIPGFNYKPTHIQKRRPYKKCDSCLEQQIGRELKEEDLIDCPANKLRSK